MRLRRLRADDDLSGAIGLLQRFFAEEGFNTPADVIARNARTMAGLDQCVMIVAEAEEGAIGIATLSLEFGIEYGWSAEMGDLYVIPEMRARGVAKALVAEVELALKERGASGCQVTVTPEAERQHGLRRFYEALGFADEGRSILYRHIRS